MVLQGAVPIQLSFSPLTVSVIIVHANLCAIQTFLVQVLGLSSCVSHEYFEQRNLISCYLCNLYEFQSFEDLKLQQCQFCAVFVYCTYILL